MLAICTGVSASEFNESIVSLLQTVVEGKFVMGPVGTDEVTPDVDEGKFVIGPVGTEEAVANVVEGKFVIGPVSTEGVGANVVEGNLVIGPEGTDELTPVVDEGKFVIGPVGTDELTPVVDEGKFVIGPEGTDELTPVVDEGKFVIGPEGTEGVGANVDRGADVGDDTLACVRGAGVNQATSATAAKVTGGSARINFLTVRLLANFILCIVQYEFLRLNKVQIYLQRAQHDSGLMHERIVIGKRNIFYAIK
jgi:hypothetical protein